jgi:mRNA interferase RelE/StbE
VGRRQEDAGSVTYEIIITPVAMDLLRAIPDRRVQKTIAASIDRLTKEPEKQGKPLLGEFLGYRSLRAVGQRYRIIYRVDRGQILVIVVAVGIRKEGDRRDIYALAQKLLRSGLLGAP